MKNLLLALPITIRGSVSLGKVEFFRVSLHYTIKTFKQRFKTSENNVQAYNYLESK